MKKLVLGTVLASFLGATAALACEDDTQTAKQEKKSPPVAQKAEKKSVKAQKKAAEKTDKTAVAQADKG
jgi:Ni/Co efflux regulator RcnB